mmetsp:Transcript_802/g.1580  ORF Transcript_802/g.1580 Transcript_802/m.1580 type:complete len:251 (-) Transcript_802:880-1632(-)
MVLHHVLHRAEPQRAQNSVQAVRAALPCPVAAPVRKIPHLAPERAEATPGLLVSIRSPGAHRQRMGELSRLKKSGEIRLGEKVQYVVLELPWVRSDANSRNRSRAMGGLDLLPHLTKHLPLAPGALEGQHPHHRPPQNWVIPHSVKDGQALQTGQQHLVSPAPRGQHQLSAGDGGKAPTAAEDVLQHPLSGVCRAIRVQLEEHPSHWGRRMTDNRWQASALLRSGQYQNIVWGGHPRSVFQHDHLKPRGL